MSFRDDLERWVAKQLGLRVGPGFLENLLRLLRGSEGPTLRDTSNAGFDAEQLEATPADRGIIDTTETFGWLCWPSSDDAIYGWGDPYEDPPGTPVNPPLGTIQTSFSDTAHIAREMNHTSVESCSFLEVTHGVNKIAAPRDWRSATTALVVSWNLTAIYSGGSEVKAGTGIRASCVRNSYLLWFETNSSPARIWSQECTITDDVVTSVSGSPGYCEVTGGFATPHWAEFSEDGNSLIINTGATVIANQSFLASVPSSFTGQSISATLQAGVSDYTASYSSPTNYEGTRTYLVKSQFIGNTLTHIWLDAEVKEKYELEVLETIPITTSKRFSNECDYFKPTYDYARMLTDANTRFDREYITTGLTAEVVLRKGTEELYKVKIVRDTSETDRWKLTQGTLVGSLEEQDILYWPNGDPVTCDVTACTPFTTKVLSNTTYNDEIYQMAPFPTVDIRHERFCLIDLGDSNDNGQTRNKRYRCVIYRDATEKDMETLTGSYGSRFNVGITFINSLSSLKGWIDVTANQFCPPAEDVDLYLNGNFSIWALDVSDNCTVLCSKAKPESDPDHDYLNLLEGGDIETLLSISGETNPRIIIEGEDRIFGLLKH